MYIYEDQTGFVILTVYVDDILLLSASKDLLNKLRKQLMDRFKMSDMGDVSRTLGINVTRDCEKGIIPISEKDYTENVVQRYGMEGCILEYTPGEGPKPSLNRTKEKLLNKEEKRRY